MLALFIVYFLFFTHTISNYAIINSQEAFENQMQHKLMRFSLIESYIISETVHYFDAYELKNSSYSFSEGEVNVFMIDEKAYIEYAFNPSVYACLSYDLVFDTSLDYEIISKENFSIIDNMTD